ncbi:uncharacterized protein LOC131663302 [Phymastichus coffea]|uniref:uncharacterized protein LOC131663302 n=1 Tax=Phymastichus coffea TaxID=108790 RepID=UPI00273B0EFC|nr:uncharacterized protein LOC131663302 [Phymastichus coffea]XP_058789623.1 uncharacterized protein LOC131663302 [Phymastichus coffea]
MNLDNSEVVSFINNYFALADGLVPEFEYLLAENVVLDWFGKTIKGKHNVTAFMNMHKINSRHVFNEIYSSDNIGYNGKSNFRRRRRGKSKSANNSVQNGNISCENNLIYHSSPLNESVSSNEQSFSCTKSYSSTEEEHGLTFELHDDSLTNIFKLENIQSTDTEEIEQQICQIGLEEKSNNLSSITLFKEAKEAKNISIVESSMKFVEADGEILFAKKSRRQSIWNEYKLLSSISTQTWRKPCKLQIAYSLQKVCQTPKLTSNNNNIKSHCKPVLVKNQTELMNFEQIIDLSNQLVPNVNDYAGYLRNVNIEREQDVFFDQFNEYLLKNQRSNLNTTPQYINNQLALQKNICDDQNKSQNNCFSNYSIQIIIYEGRSHCRANLSEKFI